MKKIYLKPEMKVVELKTRQSLLTISGDSYNEATNGVEAQEGGEFD